MLDVVPYYLMKILKMRLLVWNTDTISLAVMKYSKQPFPLYFKSEFVSLFYNIFTIYNIMLDIYLLQKLVFLCVNIIPDLSNSIIVSLYVL